MTTFWPTSVPATAERVAMVQERVAYFNGLGGWSTNPRLKSYPETIRASSTAAASFYPAFFKALRFQEGLQNNGMIDGAVQEEIENHNIKTFLKSQLDPLIWKSIKFKLQNLLVNHVRSLIEERKQDMFPICSREDFLAGLVGVSMNRQLLVDCLDAPSLDLITDYISMTAWLLKRGSYLHQNSGSIFSVV